MWYHVMNRGNARATIFVNECDYYLFLDKLGASCPLYSAEIHAYVIMPNHFHLFMRTLEANLGRFMQRFLTAFTIAYNNKRERVGHLFQGRYKAIAVQSSRYGSEVSRYIHLNPVRGKRTEELSLAERRRLLHRYRWSSYPAYIGRSEPEAFLVTKDTLEAFGGSTRQQRRAYAHFVEQGLLKEPKNPFAAVTGQSLLGDDSFIERARQKVRREGIRNVHEEVEKKRLASVSLSQVVALVSSAYGITAKDICTRKCRDKEARQVLLSLAHQVCVGGISLADMGRQLGGISGSAVVQAHQRTQRRMERGKALQKAYNALLKKVNS